MLADTKSGRRESPLGLRALDVLRAQASVEGNLCVFGGGRTDHHLTSVKYTWVSVKEAAEIETTAPFRLHDLRHSFTTVERDEIGPGDHVIAHLVGDTNIALRRGP